MRNRSLIYLLAAALLTTLASAFAQSGPGGIGPGRPAEESRALAAADPIAAAGYGRLFDAQGNVIEPTDAFRRRALAFYLNRLIGEAPAAVRTRYQEVRKDIETTGAKHGLDDILVESLMIDWLLDAVQPPDEAMLRAKNRTLRLGHVQANARGRADWMKPDHQFGLPRSVLDFLAGKGMIRTAATESSGRAYIAECRELGVPIPPTWSTATWTHIGDLTTNFVGSGNPASLYISESTSPNGICVALPRISGQTISLLGIICLGRETNNVCFWDRAGTPLDAEVPIEDFLGGTALGDVCSDCHAGENPFVVHPDMALYLDGRFKTTAWYTPHVKPSWPQNPGPSILPEIVPLGPSDQRCTSACHNQGFAGRFPEVGALSGYCSTVLNNAIALTMPPGAPGDPGYAAHAEAMRAFCAQDPPGGNEVPGGDFEADKEFVGAPIVIGPLYGCAVAIEVRGAIRHALLTVFVNGAPQPQVVAVDPDQQLISVPPLVAGDEVYVTQIVDGVESNKSNVETVRDHTVDYPMGLPKPEIDPTVIYECGNVIAVRHLRGAKVTVYTNGGNPRTYLTGGDWTNLPPAGAPFALNDKFTADYQMCSDPSPMSDEEVAGPAPATAPTPAFDPPDIYVGQELVTVTNLLNGALTEVAEGSGAGSVKFSTAVTWMPNIDIAAAIGGPIAPGQALTIDSTLCSSAPRIKTEGVKSCEQVPAPMIQQPFVGQNAVTVTDAIPGARILVYDQTLDEIGDGAGGLVPLDRTLAAGDILTVLQQVGQCTSATGYQVAALCTTTKQGC